MDELAQDLVERAVERDPIAWRKTAFDRDLITEVLQRDTAGQDCGRVRVRGHVGQADQLVERPREALPDIQPPMDAGAADVVQHEQ